MLHTSGSFLKGFIGASSLGATVEDIHPGPLGIGNRLVCASSQGQDRGRCPQSSRKGLRYLEAFEEKPLRSASRGN